MRSTILFLRTDVKQWRISSSCQMFPFSLNTTFQPGCSEANFDQDHAIACDQWQFDRSLIKTTAVEDFQMICDHKQRKSLTQTFYMVGMLIGMINIITKEGH